MKTIVGRDRLRPPDAGVAVTVGTFDGVHVGHRMLIERAKQGAARLGAESAVLTWDRHPAVTLRPDKVPPLLTSPERRTELLEEQEIDLLAVVPFDEALSHLPAEGFATEVLAEGLGAKLVVAGRGWRFGHKAAGDVALLEEVGRDLGFDVEEVPLQEVAAGPASSTRTREAVQRGDLELARDLLGRHFDLDGVVGHGAHRGKGLGFPTANIVLDPSLVRPPRGVYAGRARVDDVWYTMATNVGVNPTFGGDPEVSPIQIEAYLLGYERDLYGKTLRLEFWTRLRDELAFESAGDLIDQMAADVERARSIVEGS